MPSHGFAAADVSFFPLSAFTAQGQYVPFLRSLQVLISKLTRLFQRFPSTLLLFGEDQMSSSLSTEGVAGFPSVSRGIIHCAINYLSIKILFILITNYVVVKCLVEIGYVN